MVVANFVTNTHNDLNSNHVLHRVMVKIKQIFNLKRGVDFRENNLRKNFNNWLHLVSDKIRSKTFFDGDLVIVIEGVNLFVEQSHGWENDLKFWLPRELPPRVKIILTIEEGSHNIAYLRKIGCRFLSVGNCSGAQLQLLSFLREKQFYAPESFRQSVFAAVEERIRGAAEGTTSGFIKSTMTSARELSGALQEPQAAFAGPRRGAPNQTHFPREEDAGLYSGEAGESARVARAAALPVRVLRGGLTRRASSRRRRSLRRWSVSWR